MKEVKVPPYEIISYIIKPPVIGNRFGAKAIVPSSYQIQKGEPWNKEFWGKTEAEACSKASSAVDKWIEGSTLSIDPSASR